MTLLNGELEEGLKTWRKNGGNEQINRRKGGALKSAKKE